MPCRTDSCKELCELLVICCINDCACLTGEPGEALCGQRPGLLARREGMGCWMDVRRGQTGRTMLRLKVLKSFPYGP